MYGKCSKYFIKTVFFTLGILINSIGIVLITKSNLGTPQIASVPYVFSLKFEKLNFGLAIFLLNIIFLIMQIVILKSKTNKKILGQLPVSFLLGYFIDMNMKVFQILNPNNFLYKFGILILGCIVLGLGISVEIAPNIVKIPGEGIVYTISKEYKIDFSKVKVIFDIILVSIAMMISIIEFKSIQGIGLGTILSALLVGKMINVFNKVFKNFYNKLFG